MSRIVCSTSLGCSRVVMYKTLRNKDRRLCFKFANTKGTIFCICICVFVSVWYLYLYKTLSSQGSTSVFKICKFRRNNRALNMHCTALMRRVKVHIAWLLIMGRMTNQPTNQNVDFSFQYLHRCGLVKTFTAISRVHGKRNLCNF